MSAVQPTVPLASPVFEEASGWWPSDRSAKSRFKAFFTRTKSERYIKPNVDPVSSDVHHDVQPSKLPASTSTNSRTKRAQSTFWSNRNFRTSEHSGKQHRSRNMTSWDPPPLIQAYTQVKIHDILDIPSTLTDVLFRNNQVRRNSISSETPSRFSLENQSLLLNDIEDSGIKHKRNWSGASTCSLSKKLFILTTSGYVLQYNPDGHNDRLPEKILELGPESVAFASDAIPGKHWVLRISHDGEDPMPAPNSKSAWSKLTIRNNDSKKLVKDLLLVFDDARSLGTWLTAVRKEIEHLGGLEYRPDSRGPGEDEANSQPRHPLKSQKSLPTFSRSSPHLPTVQSSNEEPASPVLLPPMPQWRTSRNISRSTTDSSIHTLNDLDRIRETSFSDDHSISTTHTSFTSITSSPSYTVESLSPSADYYEAPIPRDLRSLVSTPTQDDIGELSMYMATPKRSTRPVPSGSTSMDVPSDMINHDLFVRKPLPAIPDYSPNLHGKDRPISTIAPLPEPGHIRKTSARYRCESQGTITQPNTPTSTSSIPSSTRSRSSSYTQEFSPGGSQRRTASYSLFPPQTPTTEQSRLSHLSSMPSPPITTPGAVLASMCNDSGSPFATYSADEEKESMTQSRPSSRSSQQMSRRPGKVLSVDTKDAETGVEQPQRSPGVTEEHLQTCFGVSPDAPRRKLSEGKRSSSASTTASTSTLEILATGTYGARAHVKLSNPPASRQRKLKDQKSMPSLVHRPMPPAGPPPTGPLPALPTVAPSCLPLKLGTGVGRLNCVPLPTKHSRDESASSSREKTREHKEMAPPPPPPKGSSTSTSASTTNLQKHTRNLSSLSSSSSVDSVRHVTAWLASPRVAAFSSKYADNEKTEQEMAEARKKANKIGGPRLNGRGLLLSVAVPGSPAFSDGFAKLMS